MAGIRERSQSHLVRKRPEERKLEVALRETLALWAKHRRWEREKKGGRVAEDSIIRYEGLERDGSSYLFQIPTSTHDPP